MINILHLRDTNKLCGPGKTVLETTCRIDQSKYKLHIGLLLLDHEDESHNLYYQAVKQRGVSIIPIRARHQFDPRVVKNIYQVVKKYNIHIVHAHEYKSDILCLFLAKIYKVPVMTTAHGWITNTLKSKIYIELGKRVLPYFDKVIAVSPPIRDELLRKRVPENKLELIYNAIVADDYIAENFQANVIRDQFGIAHDKLLIGNIGRLSEEKGQRDFILAASKIVKQHSNVCFLLAGDGPTRPGLETLVQELGLLDYVVFVGHQHHIKPVFRDIDILALTSYTEGFPNVVLEALCMDTPVLATSVGGVPSIIENEKTGILVQAGEVDQIAQGLTKMISNMDFANQLAQNGKQKVLEKFEFANRVAKVQIIYDELYKEKYLTAHTHD